MTTRMTTADTTKTITAIINNKKTINHKFDQGPLTNRSMTTTRNDYNNNTKKNMTAKNEQLQKNDNDNINNTNKTSKKVLITIIQR
jgi:hypothetical protein